MKKSNRTLAKRLKRMNRMSFCKFSKKQILTFSMLRSFPYDLHDLLPGKDIYRAVISDDSLPFNRVSRISFNPNPSSISRANLIGKGIAYYSCDLDVSVIEACRNSLKNSSQREFTLTVSRWIVRRRLSIQIICNSLKAQSAGTDLRDYYTATRSKQKKELPKSKYRTWFLKTRFLAEQYAKNSINCEQDYLISAIHANTILKSTQPIIDGIIYPSVPYIFKGFNYAFSPRLFGESFIELLDLYHVRSIFDKKDIFKYPEIIFIKTTNTLNGDEIIWE
jgi:Fe-S cluster biosynthesis and repair protein YggX